MAPIQIFVRPISGNGRQFEFSLERETPMLQLKELVSREIGEGADPVNQRLIFAGRILEDNQLLGDCLPKGEGPYTLHLVLRQTPSSVAQPNETVQEQNVPETRQRSLYEASVRASEREESTRARPSAEHRSGPATVEYAGEVQNTSAQQSEARSVPVQMPTISQDEYMHWYNRAMAGDVMAANYIAFLHLQYYQLQAQGPQHQHTNNYPGQANTTGLGASPHSQGPATGGAPQREERGQPAEMGNRAGVQPNAGNQQRGVFGQGQQHVGGERDAAHSGIVRKLLGVWMRYAVAYFLFTSSFHWPTFLAVGTAITFLFLLRNGNVSFSISAGVGPRSFLSVPQIGENGRNRLTLMEHGRALLFGFFLSLLPWWRPPALRG